MDINTKNYENLKLLNRKQACERYSLGYSTLRPLAEKVGGLVKIGKAVRFERTVLDNYFSGLAKNCQ